MFGSRRATPRRSPALSWLALPLLALLPTALQLAGCTDDTATTPPPTLRPDAGVAACTPGSRACVCTASGDCDLGLLCNSGRCFDNEGTKSEPPDPDVRPVRPVATPLPSADASVPPADASTDSGSASNG